MPRLVLNSFRKGSYAWQRFQLDGQHLDTHPVLLNFRGFNCQAGRRSDWTLNGQCMRAGIHCWALSPPGGLMSTNLSALVAPFVTSVVLGKDVVPRVSVANLGRLIDQMVRASLTFWLEIVCGCCLGYCPGLGAPTLFSRAAFLAVHEACLCGDIFSLSWPRGKMMAGAAHAVRQRWLTR